MTKCGQRMCRHISYFTTGAFAFSGLVIFLLGVTYVGSYVGYTPTTGTGSSSNSLGPVGDGDVAPPPPPPPPPPGAPANTPSPAMAAFDTVPVYLWFPILWGIIMMIVALFGCCGIKMYSRLILGIYLILVLIIFFTELALGLVFTTLYQTDILLIEQEGSPILKKELQDSSYAITTSFFVVCFVEFVVLITVGCFRSGLTGTEKEDKREKKFQNLEDDIANRDAEREKRKMQFEMQSRRMADKLKSKTGGMFG